LREFNLRELSVKLDRFEVAVAKVEARYCSIEDIRPERLRADREWLSQMGGRASAVNAFGVMGYVAGCMTRERQRLAQIFRQEHSPDTRARALMDPSKDELVFRWEPRSVSLDDRPSKQHDASISSTAGLPAQ